jgi:hypothetical protein
MSAPLGHESGVHNIFVGVIQSDSGRGRSPRLEMAAGLRRSPRKSGLYSRILAISWHPVVLSSGTFNLAVLQLCKPKERPQPHLDSSRRT